MGYHDLKEDIILSPILLFCSLKQSDFIITLNNNILENIAQSLISVQKTGLDSLKIAFQVYSRLHILLLLYFSI